MRLLMKTKNLIVQEEDEFSLEEEHPIHLNMSRIKSMKPMKTMYDQIIAQNKTSATRGQKKLEQLKGGKTKHLKKKKRQGHMKQM